MSAPAAGFTELPAAPLGEVRANAIDQAGTAVEVGAVSQPSSIRGGEGRGADAPSRSKDKHSATEKRRRDRIHEGIVGLREVVVPQKEKEDQAAFLKSAAEYIRQLQTALQCFNAMGAVKNLPEETQWSIRALLSRGVPTAAAPAAPASAATLSFPGLPQVLLQLMGNMNGNKEHVPAHAQVLDPAQMHSAMQQAMMVQQWQQHLQQCAAQAQFSQACPPGQPGQQLGPPGAPCYDHPPPQPTTNAGPTVKEQ